MAVAGSVTDRLERYVWSFDLTAWYCFRLGTYTVQCCHPRSVWSTPGGHIVPRTLWFVRTMRSPGGIDRILVKTARLL